jgi:hypothetical protein
MASGANLKNSNYHSGILRKPAGSIIIRQASFIDIDMISKN